jgi:flavorubredoxin
MLPVDRDYEFVDDFAAHLPFIEGFHRRYMVCNKAARFWVEAVSALDIDVLAPQHGPIYRGRAVADFLAWFKELRCGVDLMTRSGHFEMGRAWNEQ